MAIEVERAAGQPAGPDVLIEDEVRPVQPAERHVALVDRRCQQVVIATSDRVLPLDRVVKRADQVMDDGVGHRRDDRLDIAVMFGTQLSVDEPIEFGLRNILVRLHARHDGLPR